MKDYTLDKLGREKFIKNYKVKNGKIIINLASKEKYVIPYTEENEKKVLSKMEEQVNNARIKPIGIINKFLAGVSYGALALALYLSIVETAILYFVVAFGLSSFFTYQLASNQIKLKDLEKQRFFLDNRKLINDNIKKSPNMTLGLDKKIVTQIERSDEQNIFDINLIDSYSLSDLKKLKRNILRFEEFKFDEQEEKDKRLEFHK